MDCPKCKCPNPPGAAYCQMCYETFNRGAAENYVRSIRRQKREEEHLENKNSLKGKMDATSSRLAVFLDEIDWGGIVVYAWGLCRRYKKAIGIAFLGVAALVTLLILHSPSIRFRALGHRLTYNFPTSPARRYLVGFQSDVKTWSEWNRQLDTPMEDFHDDEIGNVVMERGIETSSGTTVVLRPKEWIRIRRGQQSSTSLRIDLQDISVAPIHVDFDAQGHRLHRAAVPTPRLGRAFVLLVPAFPPTPLRLGNHWDEPVQWVETVGEWKVAWSGSLHWTLDSAGDCDEGTCAQLSYKGNLQPQIWAAPAWASGTIGRPVFDAHPVVGNAIFDLRHRQLISNTMSYETVMRVPIRDLGRIPWELRVGRRVRDISGDLIVQFKDRFDVHEN